MKQLIILLTITLTFSLNAFAQSEEELLRDLQAAQRGEVSHYFKANKGTIWVGGATLAMIVGGVMKMVGESNHKLSASQHLKAAEAHENARRNLTFMKNQTIAELKEEGIEDPESHKSVRKINERIRKLPNREFDMRRNGFGRTVRGRISNALYGWGGVGMVLYIIGSSSASGAELTPLTPQEVATLEQVLKHSVANNFEANGSLAASQALFDAPVEGLEEDVSY